MSGATEDRYPEVLELARVDGAAARLKPARASRGVPLVTGRQSRCAIGRVPRGGFGVAPVSHRYRVDGARTSPPRVWARWLARPTGSREAAADPTPRRPGSQPRG
jgi:hypothetical protein